MVNNETNRELLSAYLDDVLTGEERIQAEQLLANDAQAAGYLEQLRQMRECLRSVAVTPLRSSIAARVISQARAVAAAEGLASSHHVLRHSQRTDVDSQSARESFPSENRGSHSSRPTVVPSSLDATRREDVSESRKSSTGWNSWLPADNRILWSALVTTAAAILCLVAAPIYVRFNQVGQPQNLISKIPGGNDPLKDPLLGNLPSNGASEAGVLGGEQERTPFDTVVGAEEPDRSPFSSRGPVAHVMEGSGAREVLEQDLSQSKSEFAYLMTVDVVMTAEAWESSYLDGLLKEVGVPMASPILADEELTTLLDDSKVIIGSVDATAENSADAADKGKAALLFVQANGKSVDRLLIAMSTDREHFQSLSFNIAMDQQRLLLRQLLLKRSAAEKGAKLGARIVRSSNDSAFGQTALQPEFIADEPLNPMPYSGGGAALMSGPGRQSDADPATEVLIVVRKPRGN